MLILVAIAIPSIRLLRHQYNPPRADLTVKVTGHQWYWTYEYPDNGVFDSYMLKEKGDPTLQAGQRFRTDNDGPPLLAADERMVIPAGKVVNSSSPPTTSSTASPCPPFWIKQDANPGQLHETWAKVERPGVYFGHAGAVRARHGSMPIAIEAVPPAQFAQWVASKGGTMPGTKPASGLSTAISPVTPLTWPPRRPSRSPPRDRPKRRQTEARPTRRRPHRIKRPARPR